MIKKLSNNKGVQKSSTLTGIRELLREYRNKTNELIDYLQAKEEIDKTWLKEIILKDKGISEPNYEEASKGECKVIVKHKGEYDDEWTEDEIKLNPPERRGECKHENIGYELPRDSGSFNAPPVCMDCGKKLVKDNPPEHEEIEDDPEYHEVMSELKTRDFIYELVDDIGSQVTRDYEEKNGIWEGMSVSNAKSAEKCIRNFDKLFTEYVFKEKIKEYVSDKLNCYSNTDYRVALKDLSESLGLGD